MDDTVLADDVRLQDLRAVHGYTAVGGARGVGQAATRAMVWAGVLIFATDYLLTSLFTAR